MSHNQDMEPAVDLELRLRESERRFRAIFDQSPQLLGLLEPDGTLIDANETALRVELLTSDEGIGQKFWDTSSFRKLPSIVADLKVAIARAAGGEFQRFEMEYPRSNGETTFFDFSINPIRNSKGEVVLLITEGRDITESKAILDHLRLTEIRLEEAQRIAHIGHWDYDVTGEETSWSKTLIDLFGLDPADTVTNSQAFVERVHPEDLDRVRQALDHSFYTGHPYELDFRITRTDGLVRAVFAAGGPITNEKGEIVRMAGIIQDVTGRRNLEESLAKSIERLSALNKMGQAVASSLDLSAIYRHVISAGRKLLDTDAVVLFLHEGNEFHISAVDHKGDHELLGRRIPDNTGIVGEAWATGQSVWLTGEECLRRRSDQLAKASGFDPRTIIAVPVKWQEEIIGVLEAVDLKDDAFTLDDVSTLQAIANWAAITVARARQHQIRERRLEESETMAAVSQRLSGALEPQSILDLIVQTAHQLVPGSDWAVFHMLRGRPERLDPAAVAGTAADLSDYIMGRDEGIAGLALAEGVSIRVGDSMSDQRSSAYAHRFGLRSLLVVPVQASGRRLGTISLHSMEPNAFTEENERLMSILAVQAGMAIDNAYLFDSQRRARLVAEFQRERLGLLTERIVLTQEEERLRISRELHDDAGQALTSLKISLDLIRNDLPAEQETLRLRLTDLATLTGETIESLRTLAHDLRPPGLDVFGLSVALEGLCRDFSTRTSLPIHYEGVELPPLPASFTLSLYRFAQEALNNIAKHAEARKVSVLLSLLDDSLQLSIIDDGKGFNYDPNNLQWGGIGLVSMQERIALLRGTLHIGSAVNRGTRLTARVPIEITEDNGITA